MATRFIVLTCLVGLIDGAGARSARAEEPSGPAAPRRLVVSAERLLGFAYASGTQGASRNSAEIDTSGTTFGWLGSSAASTVAPRVGVDIFVVKGLTVGAAASYTAGSVETSIRSQFVFQPPEETTSTLTLAPRVGYFIPIVRSVGVWPRLGFTYVRSHSTGLTTATMGLYALTLEAPVAIRVAEHLLVTVGPTLDAGLDGALSSSTANAPLVPNRTLKETDFGLTAGFAGYF
jgi:hypothetical protein